jgi:hypothetical protein
MKKLKLYLDTSVISHLHQPDAPDKMADTLLLWEEISRCTPEKQELLISYLSEIQYTIIHGESEIFNVADIIIQMGILRPKSYDDCVHIASAVISECDYIVSWNFKHMVNVKTINGVRAISLLHGYKQVDIIQPAMLVQLEEE